MVGALVYQLECGDYASLVMKKDAMLLATKSLMENSMVYVAGSKVGIQRRFKSFEKRLSNLLTKVNQMPLSKRPEVIESFFEN